MLRWEDCVRRDLRKAGEEEDWKKKTRDSQMAPRYLKLVPVSGAWIFANTM